MIRTPNRPTMVVVGAGMAGAKVIEEVLARAPGHFQIRLFGAEPHGTYNQADSQAVLQVGRLSIQESFDALLDGTYACLPIIRDGRENSNRILDDT
jgi:hypothetical protein